MDLKAHTLGRKEVDSLLSKAPNEHRIVDAHQALKKVVGFPIIDMLTVFETAGTYAKNPELPALAVAPTWSSTIAVDIYIDDTYFKTSNTTTKKNFFGRPKTVPFLNFSYSLPTPAWDPPEIWEPIVNTVVPVVPDEIKKQIDPEEYKNLYILFEAIWDYSFPDPDPFLLKRIGDSHLFAILGSWDLSQLEVTAMRAGLI